MPKFAWFKIVVAVIFLFAGLNLFVNPIKEIHELKIYGNEIVYDDIQDKYVPRTETKDWRDSCCGLDFLVIVTLATNNISAIFLSLYLLVKTIILVSNWTQFKMWFTKQLGKFTGIVWMLTLIAFIISMPLFVTLIYWVPVLILALLATFPMFKQTKMPA